MENQSKEVNVPGGSPLDGLNRQQRRRIRAASRQAMRRTIRFLKRRQRKVVEEATQE